MPRIPEAVTKRKRRASLIKIPIVTGIFFVLSVQAGAFPLASTFRNERCANGKSLPGFCAFRKRWEGDKKRKSVPSLLNSIEKTGNGDETEPSNKSLKEFLSPSSSCRANQMSGTELAYVGDAVFELFVRSRHVWPPKRTSDLQNTVVGLVRAEHQSFLLRQLKESFPLTEKESQVMMRGRNSVTKSKNRRNPAAYQDSTALEALIGYIYITDPSRCQELLSWLESVVDNRDDSGKKS
mmetsp:Transcript_13604/g.38284  ORF Transcript_13604/g.38284 Transcript_13604/m.38284 type:complete len:238 (+) Transcript_13604:413-1126(+)